MAFADSFRSAIGAGAALQNTLLRYEDHKVAKAERRATEYGRGIDLIFPDGDMSNATPEQLTALNDHMNTYQDIVGERPGGQTEFVGMHKMNGGVAAEVRVTNPETGEVSQGPITKRGTRDDDDEVVVVSNTQQLKDPVAANLAAARQGMLNAGTRSESAYQTQRKRRNERDTVNAYETLYGQTDAGPAANQPAVPAPAPSQSPPAVEDGPQRGLTTASTAPAPIQQPAPQGVPVGPHDSYVQAAAADSGLDANLLRAVIHTESSGNPNAVSPAGAVGLMQMTPIAVEELNRQAGTNYTMEDMKDPGKNVQAGTMFLKLMIDAQGGDVEKGLAAYNGGITRLNRNGGDINKMPEETRNYVPKVLAALSGSGSATAAEAPSAAAEEASGEQPPITGDAATPSSVSIKRKQQYRKVKRLDKEIAKLEASLSGKDNDRVALAKRARIEQLGAERDAARAAAEAPGPESSDPSTPAEETVVAENPQQQKVADEMASAAPAASETEVVEAADTLQAIRPAKKLSKKQRMAIYTLARTGAIPAQDVPRILESGRLTKANLTVMKNAAGQHIAYDENGNGRVLPETREAIEMRQAKLENTQADTAFKTIENQQKVAQRELDQTTQQEKRFDEQFKHFYHVEGDTEQANAKRRADMQDMVATTQSVYGINLNDHAGRTVMNKAKELQDRYAESQEFSLLNPFSWFRDEPIYGDFGPGVLAQQIPGTPHNIDDPDEQVAAMKYTYKYLEPLQQAGLQGKSLMVGGLLKARLEKAGISPEVSTPALIQVAQERPDLLDQPDVLLRNLQSYIQAANTP